MSGAITRTTSNKRAARKALAIVVAVAAGALILKAYIAAHTLGTDDAIIFGKYAQGVRRLGALGVYEGHYPTRYNHGPFTGYLIWVMNLIVDRGLSFGFVFRFMGSLADVGAALIVFDALRRWATLRAATIAGCAVAA